MPSRYFNPGSYYGGDGGYGGYRQGDRISELLTEGGRIEARGALNSGDVWGGALSGLGSQLMSVAKASMAKDELAKQKAVISKRDAAWTTYVQGGEWQKDPKSAYAEAMRVWGPEKAPEQFNALVSAAKIGQGNPEEDRKSLGVILGAAGKLGDGGRASLYPQITALAKRVYPETKLSPEYDPKEWPTYDAIGQVLRGEKPPEAFTLGKDQVRFGADNKEIARGPVDAPKPPEPRVVGRSLVGLDGKVIYRDPEVAPKGPGLEKVEEIGPDGKARVRFVVPKEGDTYVKPTGAAKPATGQQRKALGYFNRGKEAQDIASALEEGGNVDALRIKLTPEWLNILQSDPNQAYIQAQEAFTEARLRKDSGAAIPMHERKKDALTYFKQPGDSAATIAQKQAGRNAILAGIAFESGDALKEFYGDEADGMIENYKKGSKATGTPGGKVVPVNSPEEARKLPKGTLFRTPDGRMKIR